MRRQSESDYFLVGDLDAGIVRVGIERRLDDQACFRRGCGNQVDHGLMAYQGPATPVLRRGDARSCSTCWCPAENGRLPT